MAKHLDYRKVRRDLYAAYLSGALDRPVERPGTEDDLRPPLPSAPAQNDGDRDADPSI